MLAPGCNIIENAMQATEAVEQDAATDTDEQLLTYAVLHQLTVEPKLVLAQQQDNQNLKL